jgi:DNA-binding MarR family transcriptional regulator
MMNRFDGLANEVRLMFHSMARLVEFAHVDRGVTAPMRAVLGYLDEHGATTVPRIAEARGVSRQHIQTIVNGLVDAGLALYSENPAHRRSQLVGLTAPGRSCIGAITEDEAALLSRLGAGVTVSDQDIAERTIRRLREELDELAETLRAKSQHTTQEVTS